MYIFRNLLEISFKKLSVKKKSKNNSEVYKLLVFILIDCNYKLINKIIITYYLLNI